MLRVEYSFQSTILKMMSNQVEVNNNTIDVESRVVDGSLRSAEEEGSLLKNKFEEEQDGVYDEKVESSCLNIGDKVKEPKAEEVGMETGVVLTDDGADSADVEKVKIVEGTLTENAREGRPFQEIERSSVVREVKEIEDTEESRSDMSSVVEFSGSSVNTGDEKEDEVSRLLAALRALCTSANTDVLLLCGAWQMRAHTEVLRARSHALAEMLRSSDGQHHRTTVKLRLNMDPGALGIAVNYIYFNEVRRT